MRGYETLLPLTESGMLPQDLQRLKVEDSFSTIIHLLECSYDRYNPLYILVLTSTLYFYSDFYLFKALLHPLFHWISIPHAYEEIRAVAIILSYS